MPKRDVAEEIRRKLADNPALASQVADERANLHIAEQILSAREAAGLTQEALAKLVHTSQSVIARVEDADYDGHSHKLVKRIASALGLAVRVELYDPRAVVATGVVEEITEVSQTQVPWPSLSVVGWQNLEVNVPPGLKIVA
jgi:ribosome-binding protein aMBF1 (putative translation factor)